MDTALKIYSHMVHILAFIGLTILRVPVLLIKLFSLTVFIILGAIGFGVFLAFILAAYVIIGQAIIMIL